MTAENRRYALDIIARLAPELDLDIAGVVEAFPKIYKLLDPTAHMAAAVWIDGTPYTFPPDGGDMANIAVAATVDNTTITFKVNPEDDHNDPTADQLTVTTDQADESLGTLAIDDDTHGAVFTLAQPQVEGSLNVTFSDPSAPGVEDLVFNVQIGAGATSQLAGSATVA